MRHLVALAIFWVFSTASAATLSCSIHPKKGDPLEGLAKVSLDQARATAISFLRTKAKMVIAAGELEVERGCLGYSFDVRLSDRSWIEEVMIDAGNGKIISHTHESIRQDAIEQAKDSAVRSKRHR